MASDAEPVMTVGEEFESTFGTNDPRRRGGVKPKPTEPKLTAGQAADDLDSTRKKSLAEEQ